MKTNMLSQENSINSTNLSLTIWIERIRGKGEDAPPIFKKTRINKNVPCYLIGVLDGMGGRSSAGWIDKKDIMHSGAFYASRIAKDALVKAFFNLVQKGDFRLTTDRSQLAELFSEVVFQKLKRVADKKLGHSLVRGTLFSRLATTAAFAILSKYSENLVADIFWIGDSRIYYLSPKDGLMQLTKDDTVARKRDSMQLFVYDSPLTKFLNADKKKLLNYKQLGFETPCIIISCTDGCYGYMRSPMDFEYLILDTLCNASNIQSWKQEMESTLQKIAGDDASMSLMVFGWREFSEVKDAFKERYINLLKNYIEPLALFTNDTSEAVKLLWSLYRLSYERYIKLKELPNLSQKEAEY